MNEKTKELIAIGASVSSHCQPCLTHHVGEARRLGIANDEIMDAVTVGKMVQKGAMAAMNKFIPTVMDDLGDSLTDSQQEKTIKYSSLNVYDPPMCCSTGVCGPEPDRALTEFDRAVKAIAGRGVLVKRWNFAQQPQAFT
ncbi:MAG TPA: arsenic metallochaperone ArsD family protein, partial [Desulfobacteraceae bacterium]|nr:arsenic metallochaperone ArsD family protein [Desulfobacteraceae bacterium]